MIDLDEHWTYTKALPALCLYVGQALDRVHIWLPSASGLGNQTKQAQTAGPWTGASWWWWVTMGISAHCGWEVSPVNYFILSSSIFDLGSPESIIISAKSILLMPFNHWSRKEYGIVSASFGMGSGEGYYCTLIIGDIEYRFTNSSSVDSHQKSHPILSIKSVS